MNRTCGSFCRCRPPYRVLSGFNTARHNIPKSYALHFANPNDTIHARGNLRLVDFDANAVIRFLEQETAAATAAPPEHHHHSQPSGEKPDSTLLHAETA